MIKEFEPLLKIKSIKSGKKVYDWKIPDEWNIKDAYIKDAKGKILISFKNNNLQGLPQIILRDTYEVLEASIFRSKNACKKNILVYLCVYCIYINHLRLGKHFGNMIFSVPGSFGMSYCPFSLHTYTSSRESLPSSIPFPTSIATPSLLYLHLYL